MMNKTLGLVSMMIMLLPAVGQSAQYGKVELTNLHRSDADNTTLAGRRVVFGSFTDTLDTDDAGLGWEPGVGLAYGWDSQWGQLELGLNYFGNWGGDKTYIDTAQNVYLSPTGTFPQLTLLTSDSGDFNNAYAHTIEYDSRAWGLQLLRKLPLQDPNHTLVYGLSYVNLDESFNWVGYDEIDDYQGTDTDIGRYLIDTDNHLLGMVAGAEGTLAKIGSNGRVVYGVMGGLYANHAKQSSELQVQNTYYASGSESEWKAAARIDGHLGLEFDLHKDAVICSGVNGLWLNGVALAPEQVDQVTGGAMVTSAESEKT